MFVERIHVEDYSSDWIHTVLIQQLTAQSFRWSAGRLLYH